MFMFLFLDKGRRASRGASFCAAPGTALWWLRGAARLSSGGAGPPRRGGGVGGTAAGESEGGVAVQGS